MTIYETILKAIEDEIVKCSHYPKLDAVKYFNEHKKDFKKETWDEGVDYHEDDNGGSPPGHLFTAQAKLQWNSTYTDRQMSLLNSYGDSFFKSLSYYHYNRRDEFILGEDEKDMDLGDIVTHRYIAIHDEERKHWNEETHRSYGGDFEEMTLREASNEIQTMIENSPRIQEDCIVWRWGRLPTKANGEPLQIGEAGIYKGFTGASYNRLLVGSKRAWLRQLISKRWGDDSNRYRIQYYVMKGNKAVLLDRSSGNSNWQNEILFGKNQHAVIMEQNDEKRTATVLLYPT